MDNLKFLVKEWHPKRNYSKIFLQQEASQSLADMLTALATLSGFDMASERLATALDSGDQEDEHSCFSDNTHRDFIENQQGIVNVFYGSYGASAYAFHNDTGLGIYSLLEMKNRSFAQQIATHIATTTAVINGLPVPFDQKLIASAKNSPARQYGELVVKALEKQAQLLAQAGDILGVKAEIIME